MPNDVNAAAADVITSHRLAVLRFESGTARRLVAVYDAALRETVLELRRVEKRLAAGQSLDTRRRTRLEAMRREIRAVIVDLRAAAMSTLDERAAAVALAEARFTTGTLARTVGLNLRGPALDAVTAAVALPLGAGRYADRIAADLLAVQTAVQDSIGAALSTGASAPRAARMLASTGVVETYRGRLVAIARTEIQRVANDTALAAYGANEDVIGHVQVVATLDSRTCPVCGSFHDKVYPLVNGRPQGLDRPPPFHPRCRCFMAPVVRPLADLGLPDTAANRRRYTGEPSTARSFEAWLRTRPAAEVDEVFGVEVGAAWRAGRLRIDQVVSGMRTLSLTELRNRYPETLAA